MIDRPVGEVFKHGNDEIITVAASDIVECMDCAFVKHASACTEHQCAAHTRADSQRVVFMLVDDFIVYRLQGKSMI